MMFIITLALQLYTLIKRQVQKALEERNRPLEGLMPNRIRTWRPQTNELLAAFDNIQRISHVRGDEIETYVTTLNSLQKEILQLLEIPEEVYSVESIVRKYMKLDFPMTPAQSGNEFPKEVLVHSTVNLSSKREGEMMIARKSVGIALVISLLVIFGCGKEKEKPKSFPQVYPEGVPKEIVSEKDGAKMILIPAGEFKMGTDVSEIPQLVKWAKQWDSDPKASWFEDETPLHIVYFDTFYIDVYEVTNAQYAKFLNEYGKNDDGKGNKLLNLDDEDCLIEKVGDTYKPKAGYENHPVIEVSWYGAVEYAEFYGKRLPTEAEWEKASRGGLVEKKFPWGDSKPDGSNANFADKNTNYSWSDKNVDDGYEHTAPVGSYLPNGYGLYDMAGNVWERCSDWYDANYYANSPKNNPKGPNSGSMRVLRGGSWHDLHTFSLRCADRLYGGPAYAANYGGFRCAQDL